MISISAFVAAALWALAAGLALSLVLGLLVLAVIAVGRPAASMRQGLWTIASAAAGFAPVAILAAMLLRGALGAQPVPPVPPAHHTASVHAAQTAHASAPAHPPAARATGEGSASLVPALPDIAPRIAGLLVALWLLGAAFGLAGLARSVARVRGLKARSSPLDGALAEELPWLTTTPGREIYLRLSYETETPIAIGFTRPVILLPTEMATAAGLTSIEPLIMHEYAHLARYDDWTNLLQRATERLFWFNPLVWILGRRIALEREVAADEAVVARTHDAKRYASTLWRMAQEMRMPEHVVVAPGAMLTRKQISVRIERLLDEHPAGQRYIGSAAFALVIIALTGVAAVAAGAPPAVLAHPVAAAVVNEPPDTSAPPAAGAPAAQPAPKIVVAPVPKIVVNLPPAHELVDTTGLTQRIQAEVQHKLADAVAMRDDVPNGPITRDMVRHCTGCDFSNRDLHGLDLSNISLVGDDFSRANLRGTNFAGSRLEGLSFAHADLTRANLHASKITGVDFSRATLDGADLSDALLTGVDLSKVSMDGANTSGIKLVGSSLP